MCSEYTVFEISLQRVYNSIERFLLFFPLRKSKMSDIATELDSCEICHVIYPNIVLFFFKGWTCTAGGSWARGLIGAVAAGLCHSHSHARSKPCLQPTPKLMAMPDP